MLEDTGDGENGCRLESGGVVGDVLGRPSGRVETGANFSKVS